MLLQLFRSTICFLYSTPVKIYLVYTIYVHGYANQHVQQNNAEARSIHMYKNILYIFFRRFVFCNFINFYVADGDCCVVSIIVEHMAQWIYSLKLSDNSDDPSLALAFREDPSPIQRLAISLLRSQSILFRQTEE